MRAIGPGAAAPRFVGTYWADWTQEIDPALFSSQFPRQLPEWQGWAKAAQKEIYELMAQDCEAA